MTATVVGLGKIGLPLAVHIAGQGVNTIGADISEAVVELVNAGRPPFPGETDLERRLSEVIRSGKLMAVTDTAMAVGVSEVTIVVVPLMVDSDGVPDFAAIDSATRDIAPSLKRGHLVSYETTLPVGTTRNRFTPMLKAGSGLEVGKDFHVIHSPERVFSGRVFADLRRYPKLVGGVTPACAEVGVRFYERTLEFDERPDLERPNGVWDLGSVEAAELAKLAETTYRDVNIALANEFATFAESAGLDIMKVIEAANSQPFSHIHRPGIAVGGHCIPVYPMFYLQGHPTAQIPRASRVVNRAMPTQAIDRLEASIGPVAGRTVAVLGAAYRNGVKEVAFSGVFPLVAELTNRGALAPVHDPLYTDDDLVGWGFTPHHLGDPVDAAMIQTDHTEYRTLAPRDLPGCQAIVDGRNILDPSDWGEVTLLAVGRGDLSD
jgi:nucleotide sugar dehydrogenase